MNYNTVVLGKKRPVIKIVLIIVSILFLCIDGLFLINSIRWFVKGVDNFFIDVLPDILSTSFVIGILVYAIIMPISAVVYNKNTKNVQIRAGRWNTRETFNINDIDLIDYAPLTVSSNFILFSSSGNYLTIVLKNGKSFIVYDLKDGSNVKNKLQKLLNNEEEFDFKEFIR